MPLRVARKYTGRWLYRMIRGLKRDEWRTHPIDSKYGIETSRRVGRFELATGTDDGSNIGYVGAQPSIVRKCLNTLPIDEPTAFLDIGCGKGRVLAVASEYPFASITGIEISETVAATARRNARVIAERYPERTTISILRGDATAFPMPTSRNIVLFLYNPFDAPLVERLVKHMRHLTEISPAKKFFVIYYNPVHFALFDNCGFLARYLSARYRFSEDECQVAPLTNFHDSVILYQSLACTMLTPHQNANAEVRITVPRLGAEVSWEHPSG